MSEVVKVGAGEQIFLLMGILPEGRLQPLEGCAFTSEQRAEEQKLLFLTDEPKRSALEYPLGYKVVAMEIEW